MAAVLEPVDETIAGLLEAAPDAFIAVDERGFIVLANAQAERLFGYDRRELVGQLVEILIPDGARTVHLTHRLRYGKDPVQRPMRAGMELAGRRRDGSEFPAEISLAAVTTRGGELVAAVVRDASDRRRADLKFRSLLEAAPDAMLCVGAHGRIAVVNAQAERLLGYPRDELIGQPVELLVPDDARDAHHGHRDNYFASPTTRPMGAGSQLSVRRKDGSEFPADISLSALDTEDGPLVSAAIRDVTERLEAQALRERLQAEAERERVGSRVAQSQRLESLGQLAGGVAHDFNNLLAVILNHAAFVKEEVELAADPAEPEQWTGVVADIGQIELAAQRRPG